MTRTERTDTFYGNCKVRLKDRELALRCVARFYQNYHGETPTLKHADGKFENLPHGSAAFAIMGREELYLTLDDGRRMAIFISDFEGRFVVNGPIVQTSEPDQVLNS